MYVLDIYYVEKFMIHNIYIIHIAYNIYFMYPNLILYNKFMI